MKQMMRNVCLTLLALSAAPVWAADHLDGTTTAGGALADPTADITDLFSWMSADGSQVYLALNVFPVATTSSKFSNSVQYVFHTGSRATFALGSPAATAHEDIICTFDANQKISCWVGTDDYVNGDASSSSGITGTNGHFRVFAGPRDDPFFFNLDGFKHLANTIHSVATASPSVLTFDAAGCPNNVDAPTSGELVYELTHGSDSTYTCTGSGTACPAATDHFSHLNVLSIVVAVDKSLVTKGGPILSVWASTNKAP